MSERTSRGFNGMTSRARLDDVPALATEFSREKREGGWSPISEH
jgi:hypothetical protein